MDLQADIGCRASIDAPELPIVIPAGGTAILEAGLQVEREYVLPVSERIAKVPLLIFPVVEDESGNNWVTHEQAVHFDLTRSVTSSSRAIYLRDGRYSLVLTLHDNVTLDSIGIEWRGSFGDGLTDDPSPYRIVVDEPRPENRIVSIRSEIRSPPRLNGSWSLAVRGRLPNGTEVHLAIPIIEENQGAS